MAFARLLVFGFLVLSVIYLAVSLYARSLRRENLENEWAERNPGDTSSPQRAAYIKKGMEQYNASIRPKLIALIYVIPLVAMFAIMILVNVT